VAAAVVVCAAAVVLAVEASEVEAADFVMAATFHDDLVVDHFLVHPADGGAVAAIRTGTTSIRYSL
jgi:hypothetical protein